MAALCVKTWPVVPDIVALGSVADLQLQAQWLHVHGSNQLASQQPWEMVQLMDWLAPHDEGLLQPPSGAHASLPGQGLHQDVPHRQFSYEPASAVPSVASLATPIMISSAAAAAVAAAGSSLEMQHIWPINMDGQGRIVTKSAAVTAACELQLPSATLFSSRGSGQQTLSPAGSALPPWYMRTHIQDEMPSQAAPGPADAPQSTASDTPVQKLGPEMHQGRGILDQFMRIQSRLACMSGRPLQEQPRLAETLPELPWTPWDC